MKWIKASLAFSLTLLLIFVFSTRFGTVPPVGEVLNPFQGFWQNMAQVGLKKTYRIRAPELHEKTIVVFDDRGVPSIFAENDHDLYFAMGYVQARDRLWQMDFQARAAAGRISEIIGPQAIDFDKYQRRIGMGIGAERILGSMLSNDTTRMVLEAYADGINYFIDNLRKAHRPLEFKLLDYDPEPFTPIKTAYLLMYMSQTLNLQAHAPRVSATRELLGEELFSTLFPEHPYISEPVMPTVTDVDSPLQKSPPEQFFTPNLVSGLELNGVEPGTGSNNWVISGEKSQSGAPILANDPHLGLTLPSIWYEMHLHSPSVNVRGATLIGAPGVIIGINENAAWGTTNAGSFATEIYEIEFRDESRNEYLHDDEWLPVSYRVEEILVRGAPNVTDSVRYTHHGPVMADDFEFGNNRIPGGHALSWISHRPSNAILAFYMMNRSSHIDEFEQAMKFFKKPSQNWVYADVHGDIGLFNSGEFPVRFQQQGLGISDGRNSLYNWSEWIPFEHMPRERNPERGFVSSANQEIVPPSFPYYLGTFYANYERGRRINELLANGDNFTLEDMENMLMDNHSLHPEYILTWMLRNLETYEPDEYVTNVIEELESWNFRYDADERIPHFFDQWWSRFNRSLWEPLSESTDLAVYYPARATTVYLLTNQNYDAFLVNPVEVLKESFEKTVEHFTKNFGTDITEWQFASMRFTRIDHLANLPGFSVLYEKGGTSEAINALRGTHGPSWRMVVELTSPPRARVVYPGGQTGNSAHRKYTEMIPHWKQGQFYDMILHSSPDDISGRTKRIRLRP